MTDLWHPDDNECALFIEGALDQATTARIASHLATCNDCVEVIGGGAAAAREEVRVWWNRPTTWVAAAAAVVIAFVGIAVYRQMYPTASIQSIAAAAPRDYRHIPPRLTGFPFVPLQTLRGPSDDEISDPAYLTLEAAAYQAIEAAEKHPTAGNAHAAGIGCIVIHENKAAIDWLTKAAKRDPSDAHIWNDLAAAQYASGDYAAARVSNDRALQLDLHLAEARFNHALILERLDLRQQALAEWHAYLKTDQNSGWAGEAREHIERLKETP